MEKQVPLSQAGSTSAQPKKAEKKRNRRSRRSSVGSSTPVSSGSSAPRVTVRRQRH